MIDTARLRALELAVHTVSRITDPKSVVVRAQMYHKFLTGFEFKPADKSEG